MDSSNSLKVDVDLVAATDVTSIEFYYGNANTNDGGFRNSFNTEINGVEYVDTSGQTKLVKQTPYDSTLTVAGPTDLADMTGSVLMTDGSTEASGAYNQTPYKLVTTDIESVTEYQGNVWTDNPAGFDGGVDTAGNVIDGNINTRTVPAWPTLAIINMAFILTSRVYLVTTAVLCLAGTTSQAALISILLM